MTVVHLFAPQPTARRLWRLYCPTCEKERYMPSWFTPNYGWDMTCLKCGEEWLDGEMMARPFMRAWRTTNVENARRRWLRGPALPTRPGTEPELESEPRNDDHQSSNQG